MRIILDVMGGDHPPHELVRGGIAAGQRLNTEIVFSGDAAVIRNALAAEHEREGKRFTILPTTQTITMNEPPVRAVRGKRNSSLVKGLLALKQGEVEAFVSPGNTGAVVVGSILLLGRISGISRPAIAATLPTIDGKDILVLDMGANVDCTPKNLLHFALMGTIYARDVQGISQPTVALLSNGTERAKGNRLNQRTFELLKEGPLRFVGNVEGHHLLTERPADVIVCDGFAGNILLKALEGGTAAVRSLLKREISRGGLRKKLGGFLLRPVFSALRERLAYERYGGAPLLGVQGMVVIAHGRSDAAAIFGAIEAARQAVAARLNERIAQGLEEWRDDGS